MLLLRNGALGSRVQKHLAGVQPNRAAPSVQLTSHRWILGGADSISREAQLQIGASTGAEVIGIRR